MRRSVRERQLPEHYGEWASVATGTLVEPTTVAEALASPDRSK